MCFFSTPSAPPSVQMPAAPAAPSSAPQSNDPTVVNATQSKKQAQLKASAANNTMVTGGNGLTTPASTGGKQLFGQ